MDCLYFQACPKDGFQKGFFPAFPAKSCFSLKLYSEVPPSKDIDKKEKDMRVYRRWDIDKGWPRTHMALVAIEPKDKQILAPDMSKEKHVCFKHIL
jgi:hypothetical protein